MESTWGERILAPVLVVTYWFDPGPSSKSTSVRIRFKGRRLGVSGRLQPADTFTTYEIVKGILPGSGHISVTATIPGLNPGDWSVSAEVVSQRGSRRGTRSGSLQLERMGLVPRLWQRWAPAADPRRPVRTCLLPLGRKPGVLPGMYTVLVAAGVLVALVAQAAVLGNEHRSPGPSLVVSVIAVGAGALGAKAWFVGLHRRRHLWNGWCIQGFVVGAVTAATAALAVAHLPVGAFLDAATPGLLLGMGVGRTGCLTAGCCCGRPTAARWGLWSSDQRVGTRRIPTQLLDSALCLTLGLTALWVVLDRRLTVAGCVSILTLAAYTLGRQAVLRLRTESRQTRFGSPAVAAAAAAVLLALGVACV